MVDADTRRQVKAELGVCVRHLRVVQRLLSHSENVETEPEDFEELSCEIPSNGGGDPMMMSRDDDGFCSR